MNITRFVSIWMYYRGVKFPLLALLDIISVPVWSFLVYCSDPVLYQQKEKWKEIQEAIRSPTILVLASDWWIIYLFTYWLADWLKSLNFSKPRLLKASAVEANITALNKPKAVLLFFILDEKECEWIMIVNIFWIWHFHSSCLKKRGEDFQVTVLLTVVPLKGLARDTF